MQKTASYTKTRFSNIYKTATGTYRARRKVNGVLLSKNHPTLKAARTWLSTL